MPKRALLVLAAGLALACDPVEPGSTATPELPADPTVLVVVIDGARTQETLGDNAASATGLPPWAMMPTVWDELVPRGVRATAAWALASTTTVPTHAAMISGRRDPPVANYPPGVGPGAYLPQLPSITHELLGARPELGPEAAVTAANTELLEVLAATQWPGAATLGDDAYLFVEGSDGGTSHDDRDVLDAVAQALDGGALRLALANLHQVDRSGHNGETDAYPNDIQALDRPLVELWRSVQEHPDYGDRSYLLLVSDHGRHNASSSEPPWRHHGCACSGCRRVPFLLLGPGVRAGEDLDTPLLLVDVAPTLGALLGVSLPWADGLVRDDLLVAETGFPSRPGLAGLALAGGHPADLRYRQDPGHRTALWVDGQRLSDPGALVVEAPALAAEGERAWACWRELSARVGETRAPWLHHCAAMDDGGSWSAIAAPVDEAGPYGRIWLEAVDGELVAAWVHSPNGSTSGGGTDPDDEGSTVSLRVARWDGHSWTETQAATVPSFPTDLAVARDGDALHIAVGAADPEADEDLRQTRRIWLAGVDGEGQWAEPVEVDLDALRPGDPSWRIEAPALSVTDDGRLMLAATGFGSAGSSQAIVAASDDGGASFATQRLVALPGPLLPLPRPVWLGERAVFPALVDGEVQLCAAGVDEDASCLATGSSRALQLEAAGGTLHAILDADVGDWERRQWKASAF